jgi:bis(5'-nucleosidyl)-tetraphosphatase
LFFFVFFVFFVVNYFGGIIMSSEHSYGVIPLKKARNQWQVLLVQHQAGHWGFPKGHAEEGENDKQAAERELNEETGQSIVNWLPYDPVSEHYFFSRKGNAVKKTVTYFLAEVSGELILQQKEIQSAKWVPISEASKIITFDASRSISKQVEALLNR